jgi:hypothetical protein
MIKLLERKRKLVKMFFSQKPALVNLQVTVLGEAEESESRQILYKVVVEAKVEKTIFKAEETVKAKGIFKAESIFKEEEIIKAEAIFKATVKVEDKLHTEVKAEAENRIQAVGEISIKLFVEDVTKLVIMQKIVELPLIKFPSFIKTQHSLQMIEMMMVQNMSLPHLQQYKFH